MRLSSLIGLRFLRAPRRDKAVSVITWISGAGVALGVTALVVTISVMNGFRANLFDTVTGSTPNARVVAAQPPQSSEEYQAFRKTVESIRQVEATAPYFSRQAFLNVQGQYRMVVLRGIDPALEPKVTQIAKYLGGEVLPSLSKPVWGLPVLAKLEPAPGEQPGIILGGPLARGMGLTEGDTVELISPAVRPTPLGPIPIVRHFRLVGVFESGLGGNDEVIGFVDIRQALLLFRQAAPTGIAARLRDPDADIAPAVQAVLPGATVTGWTDEHKNVFQVMKLEKAGLFLILALILVVSFFNIISSIVMLVVEKRQAIGTLKAMGATDRLVRNVFFMQGVWIGAIGTAAGVGLGLALCWLFSHVEIIRLPTSVFPTTHGLPVAVDGVDLLLISACSFFICLAVTLYPARQAARIHPVESLRFDI